jgi:hypothetical protein
MRFHRKPTRAAVLAALRAWATFARPRDPEKGTAARGESEAAEGTTGGSDASESAPPPAQSLSAAIERNFGRGREP